VSDAKMLVQDLVVVVKEGDVYAAEVVDVKDFGAVVKIARAKEALLHISELTHDPQLLKKNTLAELLAVGQRLEVKVLAVDKATGMTKVSRKSLLPADSLPDTLTATPHVEATDGRALPWNAMPSFPMTPPKKWSREYFKNNVATPADIEAAMTGRTMGDAPSSSSKGPSHSPSPSHSHSSHAHHTPAHSHSHSSHSHPHLPKDTHGAPRKWESARPRSGGSSGSGGGNSSGGPRSNKDKEDSASGASSGKGGSGSGPGGGGKQKEQKEEKEEKEEKDSKK
jgi:predicted RNA-binding protein with RPS1 domain